MMHTPGRDNVLIIDAFMEVIWQEGKRIMSALFYRFGEDSRELEIT